MLRRDAPHRPLLLVRPKQVGDALGVNLLHEDRGPAKVLRRPSEELVVARAESREGPCRDGQLLQFKLRKQRLRTTSHIVEHLRLRMDLCGGEPPHQVGQLHRVHLRCAQPVSELLGENVQHTSLVLLCCHENPDQGRQVRRGERRQVAQYVPPRRLEQPRITHLHLGKAPDQVCELQGLEIRHARYSQLADGLKSRCDVGVVHLERPIRPRDGGPTTRQRLRASVVSMLPF
mmetsp:Transcript_10154/g.29590  ORF Transcript_10154/g.29590 Transcript_10154/m.29590 type:complete len:232 (-) Transcript_10154:723-1418(-)